MRRLFAAIALAALAAAPAAAKEEVYFTVTLQEARLAGAAAPPGNVGRYAGRNDGRLQQLQLQSIAWGPRVTKVDSFTVKQSVRPAGTSDLTMKRGTGVSATGENVQGAPDIVITASRIPWPQGAAPPPPEGSMRVKVRLPWLACEEGKAYRKLIIGDAVTRYELSEVVVAGCAAGGVAFDYARIAVVPARPR